MESPTTSKSKINEFNLYEEVYLNAYESMAEAKQSLKNHFEFYNQSRKRQTLNATPDQVYYESIRLLEAV